MATILPPNLILGILVLTLAANPAFLMRVFDCHSVPGQSEEQVLRMAQEPDSEQNSFGRQPRGSKFADIQNESYFRNFNMKSLFPRLIHDMEKLSNQDRGGAMENGPEDDPTPDWTTDGSIFNRWQPMRGKRN